MNPILIVDFWHVSNVACNAPSIQEDAAMYIFKPYLSSAAKAKMSARVALPTLAALSKDEGQMSLSRDHELRVETTWEGRQYCSS